MNHHGSAKRQGRALIEFNHERTGEIRKMRCRSQGSMYVRRPLFNPAFMPDFKIRDSTRD
ncbi:MAG: hypothetical protein NVS3B11_09040 [Collimonas sp.]